jgi:hypothetical protein
LLTEATAERRLLIIKKQYHIVEISTGFAKDKGKQIDQLKTNKQNQKFSSNKFRKVSKPQKMVDTHKWRKMDAQKYIKFISKNPPKL